MSLVVGTICMAALAVMPASGQEQPKGGPGTFISRPAVLDVAVDLVNRELQPFKVSSGSFGNSLMKGFVARFEPAMYREQFWVVQDHANRVYPDEVPGKSWQPVDHGADPVLEDGGQSYLQMALRARDTETIGNFFLGSAEQTGGRHYVLRQEKGYIIWAMM